jgi:hypothetical protein
MGKRNLPVFLEYWTGRLRRLSSAALAAALATLAHADDAARPHLSGIVIGPEAKEALFSERSDSQRPIIVPDGATIEGFKVEVVDAETVILVGPKGALTLVLQQGAGASRLFAPPPDPIQTDATKAGESVGLLAIERDACARAGHLPGVVAESELKLRRVIGAMANLPPRTGVDATRNAPTKAISFGMSAGLDEARHRSTATVLGLAECRDLDVRWKQTAGRYGLL